jgi:hypothetical protein
MDDAPAPSGPTDFPVDDQQRQAAVNHLEGEFARGVLDAEQLATRKSAVLGSTTVAQLLAATAAEPVTAAAPSTGTVPTRRTNVLALVAGVAAGALILVLVASRLVA